MEDEREILYIALGIMIAEYLLSRAENLLEKLSSEITEETIKRPQW